MFKFLMIILFAMLLCKTVRAELRDPTLPGNLPREETSDAPAPSVIPLKLNAIWISGNKKRAIINGVTLKTGQSLNDGSQLIKIHPHYVVIKKNAVTNKLFLVPSVKKNQVK